ncbi:hypothetical protein WJX73_004818 [Symbiochloris irregularis]|uniref:Large ribosomal subunit protein mL46 N-terminal domain-containing protein n=1 Tax=Symbiochloris irregularis TaxID=706552 RepID=A0AAW1P0H1_9CHLO
MHCGSVLRQLSSLVPVTKNVCRELSVLSALNGESFAREESSVQNYRHLSAASGAVEAGKLTVALILERLPVITPIPPQWESDYQAWSQEFEDRKRDAWTSDCTLLSEMAAAVIGVFLKDSTARARRCALLQSGFWRRALRHCNLCRPTSWATGL